MKIIHGPSYRYQGELLQEPEIILVQDHHYHKDHGHAVKQLLEASVCPPDQHLLVFDHVLQQDEFSHYPHVCLPLLMAVECEEFNQAQIDIRWAHREHAFNFIINKPRPNRILLLDMVHELGLTNYVHTLCWREGYKSIVATDYTFGDEKRHDRGISHGPHKNCSNYLEHLKERIFENSCVSLITEPAFYERETILTEKTLMAIWGGTLPLWVGGWMCADTWRDLGFDVFDDIINHDYQYAHDPHDRCRLAFAFNKKWLQEPVDLEPLRDRLVHNLELLKKNIFLDQLKDLVMQHPSLQKYVQTYRHGTFAGMFS